MGYSKNKLKMKNSMKIILVILVLLLVTGISILIMANIKDVVTIGKVSDKADSVSEDIAKNSKPIIVDNIVIGGVYNNEFVSADKYVAYSSNKINTEMNVYTNRGRSGTFKINNIVKKDTYTQAVTSSLNVIDEYIAIPSSDVNAMAILPVKVDPTSEDYSSVKKALGKYRLLNNSVNISSVYDVSINLDNTFKIICATSSDIKGGVYSTVIFTNPNRTKSKIIKYSYIKDRNNASNFPVYSFEFAADLNNDSNSEIIIREVTEFDLKYDVLEYNKKDDNFVEILSTTLKLEK